MSLLELFCHADDAHALLDATVESDPAPISWLFRTLILSANPGLSY